MVANVGTKTVARLSSSAQNAAIVLPLLRQFKFWVLNFNRCRNTQEWGEHPATLTHCLGGCWRRAFFRPFPEAGIAKLEAPSDRVDAPWALHTEQLARERLETEDTLPPSTLHNSSIKRRNPGTPGDRGHAARVGPARLAANV